MLGVRFPQLFNELSSGMNVGVLILGAITSCGLRAYSKNLSSSWWELDGSLRTIYSQNVTLQMIMKVIPEM